MPYAAEAGYGAAMSFTKLYDANDPEAEMGRLYGASREQLVRIAGM